MGNELALVFLDLAARIVYPFARQSTTRRPVGYDALLPYLGSEEKIPQEKKSTCTFFYLLGTRHKPSQSDLTRNEPSQLCWRSPARSGGRWWWSEKLLSREISKFFFSIYWTFLQSIKKEIEPTSRQADLKGFFFFLVVPTSCYTTPKSTCCTGTHLLAGLPPKPTD